MLAHFALYTMWCRASLLPPPLRVAEPIPLPKSGKGSHPIAYLYSWPAMHPTWCMAERVGFEPTSRDHREPLFESGALSQLGNLSFQIMVRSDSFGVWSHSSSSNSRLRTFLIFYLRSLKKASKISVHSFSRMPRSTFTL